MSNKGLSSGPIKLAQNLVVTVLRNAVEDSDDDSSTTDSSSSSSSSNSSSSSSAAISIDTVVSVDSESGKFRPKNCKKLFTSKLQADRCKRFIQDKRNDLKTGGHL